MSVRIFTPVEKNHLLKFGFNLTNLAPYGEMPVEYITGKAQFLHNYLTVNQQVLIPRVETEELVEKIVKLYQDQTKISFLEVGTGSGAIGLSLFKIFSALGIEVNCTLTDISPTALQVAQENLNNLIKTNQQDKIKLVQSDLLTSLNEVEFDFCVANLPYIPTARLKNLAPSVKDFEPQLALDGGADGLMIIKKLLTELQAKNFQGDLFLEVDDTHTKEKLFELGFNLKEVWSDSLGNNRFAWFIF